MSYDINFWKQDRPLPLTPQEIYTRLSRGEPVEGLARLPVDDILARLRARFPAFDPSSELPDVDVENGNIEFGWSDQHFRFDLRGDVSAADRNALVQIMRDFGCPLYDPQVNKRYDTAEGTQPADAPAFEDLTPEQREQFDQLKSDLMGAMSSGQKQKRGCAGSAALFLLALGTLAWTITRHLALTN